MLKRKRKSKKKAQQSTISIKESLLQKRKARDARQKVIALLIISLVIGLVIALPLALTIDFKVACTT